MAKLCTTRRLFTVRYESYGSEWLFMVRVTMALGMQADLSFMVLVHARPVLTHWSSGFDVQACALGCACICDKDHSVVW